MCANVCIIISYLRARLCAMSLSLSLSNAHKLNYFWAILSIRRALVRYVRIVLDLMRGNKKKTSE